MYDFEVPISHSFISNGIVSHNCQGQTLDCVEMDLGEDIFAPGQFYTALSRVRSTNGLCITNLSTKGLMSDAKVREFYEKMESK
jgi:ATP-dependent exoDNAse (exonuclease V) alpha subunit